MMKLPLKTFLSFLLIGLAGQLAWTIENMYFNLFLFNTITTDPTYIATMVAASAITATLTTLLMGALSDKLGRRKGFISFGYLLWGVSIALFGLISPANVARLFPAANAIALAAVIVIVMDCVMTFFGSTANDAAFNAYVTESTAPDNRGRVESVLATLPLIAMLVVFGALDPLTQRGDWQTFFLIIGVVVFAVGLLSLILVKEPKVEKKQVPFFRNIWYGFKPATIRANRSYYLTLLAFAIYSIAIQVFFPYFIIYIQKFLDISNYALLLAVVLISASILSILSGILSDRVPKRLYMIPALLIMFLGLIALYFVRAYQSVLFAGIVMMAGQLMVTATLSAMIRDRTPIDQVGLFQGVRMFFAVFLPMVIGPYIGSYVIKMTQNSDGPLISSYVPTPAIFLVAAVILLFTFIPLLLMKKEQAG